MGKVPAQNAVISMMFRAQSWVKLILKTMLYKNPQGKKALKNPRLPDMPHGGKDFRLGVSASKGSLGPKWPFFRSVEMPL
jgi:hypothetical protein